MRTPEEILLQFLSGVPFLMQVLYYGLTEDTFSNSASFFYAFPFSPSVSSSLFLRLTITTTTITTTAKITASQIK